MVTNHEVSPLPAYEPHPFFHELAREQSTAHARHLPAPTHAHHQPSPIYYDIGPWVTHIYDRAPDGTRRRRSILTPSPPSLSRPRRHRSVPSVNWSTETLLNHPTTPTPDNDHPTRDELRRIIADEPRNITRWMSDIDRVDSGFLAHMELTPDEVRRNIDRLEDARLEDALVSYLNRRRRQLIARRSGGTWERSTPRTEYRWERRSQPTEHRRERSVYTNNRWEREHSPPRTAGFREDFTATAAHLRAVHGHDAADLANEIFASSWPERRERLKRERERERQREREERKRAREEKRAEHHARISGWLGEVGEFLGGGLMAGLILELACRSVSVV